MPRVGVRPIVVALFAIAVALASGGASYAGEPVEPESKLDTPLRMVLAQTQGSSSATASAGLTALGLSIAVYDGDRLLSPSDGVATRVASAEPLRFGALVRVTGDPERVADTGATVGGIIGNIVSARATMDELLAIAALPNVTWVESSRKMDSASVDVPPAPAAGTVQPALDESIPFIGADIWQDQGITGEGIVVGVIDTGIWPEHPSFKGPQGDSIFTGGWDQTDQTGPPPPGFAYGTSWTQDDFNNDATNFTDLTGHGTAVTDVVAGREVEGLAGVAPGAGIYAIKSTGFSSDQFDAIDQAILAGADILNFSIGGHDGPHDGTSGLEEALTFAFNEMDVFVAASAGNDGDKTIHAKAPVNPDERTDIVVNLAEDPLLQNLGPGQFNFYYKPAVNEVCAGVTTPNGFNVGPVCPGDSVFIDTLDGCAFVGNFGPNPANGNNEINIDIIGPGAPFACPFEAAAGQWSLYFDGSDVGLPTEVEGWSLDGTPFGGPFGNTDSTVHIPGTARDIVTAGAYVTRTSYVGQDGETYFADPPEGDRLADFSSRGPSLAFDVIKPDITAPGVNILAANSIDSGLGPEDLPASHPGELFQAISGTSMSSPHVAGSAALLKALHPDWTPAQIKSALMLTARPNPDFGPPPNNFVGAGNLDLSTIPINDDFDFARDLSDEILPFNDTVFMPLATVEEGEPPSDCPLDDPSGTVWYQFQATAGGLLRADTTGTDFSTAVDVFRRDLLGEHELVTCSACDVCEEADRLAEWELDPADGVYSIRVSGSLNGINGSAAPAGAGGNGLLHFRLSFVEAQDGIWGDNNCSGSADPVDSLLTLRFDAGLSTNTGDCPELGQVVDILDASPHPWGDVDCSGAVNPVDSLKLLRFDAGLGASQAEDCPPIGAEITVAEI